RWYSDREDFYKNLGDSLTKDNHYSPGVSWTLYPTNGDADDWVWGDTLSKPRIVTLTTEIGSSSDGFWPAALRIPVLESENIQTELFLAKIADNPYRLAPPEKPVPHVADTVTPNFDVTWTLNDTINPAASYTLYQLTNKQTVTDAADVDNGYWNLSRMALSTTRKHSGTSSWKTQNANGVNHWLVSKTPYLVKPNDSLKFWVWYDVESGWDYFYAQVSVDGGNTFINLANNLTTNANPNHLNLGNGITGQSGVWVRAAYNLSAYEGKQVIIRLTLFTDSFTLGEGVYIDDIENVDIFGTNTQVATGIADTTYHFSNKPVGTYFYRLTATDAQGQVGRLSNYVVTNVKQTFVVGDVSGDNHVDLADLSAMVSYLTTGTPVPNPLARGNVNCTGTVDLADLSVLVAYLTGAIGAPQCP
ncbi:MAG: dockerin type I domain-containing protein, partial [Candidatus Zixiibacteriota bacterium]